MTGDSAPYCMVNDNLVMLLFVMNFVGIAYVFLMNGTSIIERLKCIFYYESKSTPFNDRTHITWICNFLLYAQTIFYSTILTVEYLRYIHGLAIKGSALFALAISATIFASVLLLKRIVYSIVNNIMFTKAIAEEWNNLYFFTIKLLGFALSPAVIAILFIPGIPFIYVEVYLTIVLLAYVYTIFCGLIRIIFPKKRNFLDIFLYLCALEFLPIAMVWKSALQLNEFITIKI
ncbi:MAG: DUF4271 domain-containing protein [Bacteroidaceae bacterium]|nr:DUF4271 domain-containing protein [Bacteroidaceae bacterium]